VATWSWELTQFVAESVAHLSRCRQQRQSIDGVSAYTNSRQTRRDPFWYYSSLRHCLPITLLISFDVLNPSSLTSSRTWRKVEITQIHVMQFSPPSRHLSPLWCNSFLRALFSNTFSIYPHLNIRNQVSHPYKTAHRIAVFYIIILMFFQ
jgi:hypothetical protein